MKFKGYICENGNIGVRNHVLVLSSAVCANGVVDSIEREVDDVVCITHEEGCAQVGADREQTDRTLVGTAVNPNVAAVLIVGLGCETLQAELLVEKISESNKPVKAIVVQKLGGTSKAVKEGIRLAREMVRYASSLKRKEVDMSRLTLALECGGSDSYSGLSANPALGVASDLIVKSGGRVILSETTEMIGAEHLLGDRTANKNLRKKLIDIVSRVENRALDLGVEIRGANPTPGNIEGGLTTLEEKALGCIVKAGRSKIIEVVEYATRPKKKGLIIMDTPGQDVDSVTGMVAGGAQLTAFTTGRGTPMGSPIAPVLKISSNSHLYRKMKENIDINAGVIIDGKETIQKVGCKIFSEIIKIASGKKTKSEILKQRQFSINRLTPSF